MKNYKKSVIIVTLLLIAISLMGCTAEQPKGSITIVDKDLHTQSVLASDGNSYIVVSNSSLSASIYAWKQLEINHTYSCIFDENGVGQKKWIESCIEVGK
jgi:hypothetical protein